MPYPGHELLEELLVVRLLSPYRSLALDPKGSTQRRLRFNIRHARKVELDVLLAALARPKLHSPCSVFCLCSTAQARLRLAVQPEKCLA
jgi:hypothetical protein